MELEELFMHSNDYDISALLELDIEQAKTTLDAAVSPAQSTGSTTTSTHSSGQMDGEDDLYATLFDVDLGYQNPQFQQQHQQSAVSLPRPVLDVLMQDHNTTDEDEADDLDSYELDQKPFDFNNDQSCGSPSGSNYGTNSAAGGREFFKNMQAFLESLTPDEHEGIHDLLAENAMEDLMLDLDSPLDKAVQSKLKKLRRKVRNKLSAAESRKRRKNYLSTLEDRVERYNKYNCALKDKVSKLETRNKAMVTQLKKLRELLVPTAGAAVKTATSSCLMLLMISFALSSNPMPNAMLNGASQLEIDDTVHQVSAKIMRSLKEVPTVDVAGAADIPELNDTDTPSKDTVAAYLGRTVQQLRDNGLGPREHNYLLKRFGLSTDETMREGADAYGDDEDFMQDDTPPAKTKPAPKAKRAARATRQSARRANMKGGASVSILPEAVAEVSIKAEEAAEQYLETNAFMVKQEPIYA